MAGEQILSSLCQESNGKAPAWQKVYGILENAIYGGRVDNNLPRGYSQGTITTFRLSNRSQEWKH